MTLQNIKCKGADGKPALMLIRYIVLKEKSTTKAKDLQTNLKEVFKERRSSCRKRSLTKKNKKAKTSKNNRRNLSKRLNNRKN